jgi:hypothetical protein
MLDERTRTHIERELTQLRRLLQDYAELLAISSSEEPELISRTALSTVLQSFYQGVESVFQTVAKRTDQHMPTGADWHRQLVNQMAKSSATRSPLISANTVERLEPYLGFRHLARHTYPFSLEWNRMCQLVQELASVSERFCSDVRKFIEHAEHSDS